MLEHIKASAVDGINIDSATGSIILNKASKSEFMFMSDYVKFKDFKGLTSDNIIVRNSQILKSKGKLKICEFELMGTNNTINVSYVSYLVGVGNRYVECDDLYNFGVTNNVYHMQDILDFLASGIDSINTLLDLLCEVQFLDKSYGISYTDRGTLLVKHSTFIVEFNVETYRIDNIFDMSTGIYKGDYAIIGTGSEYTSFHHNCLHSNRCMDIGCLLELNGDRYIVKYKGLFDCELVCIGKGNDNNSEDVVFGTKCDMVKDYTLNYIDLLGNVCSVDRNKYTADMLLKYVDIYKGLKAQGLSHRSIVDYLFYSDLDVSLEFDLDSLKRRDATRYSLNVINKMTGKLLCSFEIKS